MPDFLLGLDCVFCFVIILPDMLGVKTPVYIIVKVERNLYKTTANRKICDRAKWIRMENGFETEKH